MTPKSLLRHKLAVSRIDEMGPGTCFHRVLQRNRHARRGRTRCAASCCRRARCITTCWPRVTRRASTTSRCVRLEQLYPLPVRSLTAELAKYPNAEVVWCQEEPENMGAWTYIDRRIEEVLAPMDVQGQAAALYRPAGIGRDRRPARTSVTMQEQKRLVDARARQLTDSASMATDIKVPTLGESVTEATVAQWFKQVGERGRGGRAAGRARNRQGNARGQRAIGRHACRRSWPRPAPTSRSGRCWAASTGPPQRRRRRSKRPRPRSRRRPSPQPKPAPAAPSRRARRRTRREGCRADRRFARRAQAGRRDRRRSRRRSRAPARTAG